MRCANGLMVPIYKFVYRLSVVARGHRRRRPGDCFFFFFGRIVTLFPRRLWLLSSMFRISFIDRGSGSRELKEHSTNRSEKKILGTQANTYSYTSINSFFSCLSDSFVSGFRSLSLSLAESQCLCLSAQLCMSGLSIFGGRCHMSIQNWFCLFVIQNQHYIRRAFTNSSFRVIIHSSRRKTLCLCVIFVSSILRLKFLSPPSSSTFLSIHFNLEQTTCAPIFIVHCCWCCVSVRPIGYYICIQKLKLKLYNHKNV